MIDTMHPRFSTFTEFVNAADSSVSPKYSKGEKRRRSHDTVGVRDSFFECKTWDESLDVARKGWPEGYASVKKMAASIFDLVSDKVIRPTVFNEVTGDMLDMGAVMEGVPECFLQWQNVEDTQNGANQVIRIGLNCCVSGGISKEIITRKGAAVVALCEALELSGRRCEIVLCHSVGDWGSTKPKFSMITTVKESWAPLQGDQVAFALAHPDCFRRLVFSLQEACPDPDASGANGGGYGPICELDPEDHECQIYIGTSILREPQWGSTELTTAWVLKKLKEQGVDLQDA